MQRQHLGPEQIIPTLQPRRQRKIVRHARRLHILIRPLPVHIVPLVNLGPAGADARGLAGVGHRPVQHVRDGARVRRAVPLHLDGVAGLGRVGGHARGYFVAVDVARDVVGGDVRDRVVGGGHADGGLVAGGLAVDPELVEVLVGGGEGGEGYGEGDESTHGG